MPHRRFDKILIRPLTTQEPVSPPAPVSMHLGDLRVTARDAIGIRTYNSALGAFGWLTYRIYFPTLDSIRNYSIRVPTTGNLNSGRVEEITEIQLENDFRQAFATNPFDAYGYLTDVVLYFSEGLTTVGATFAQGYVRRWNGVPALSGAFDAAVRALLIRILFQGYLQTFGFINWPPGIFKYSAEGPGLLRSITGTNPAAGLEIIETVPTNARWKLRSFSALLVTSGIAGIRTVRLILSDGTSDKFIIEATSTQIAGQSLGYNALPQGAASPTSSGAVPILIPADLQMSQGWTIRTNTSGLLGGDNWDAPELIVEEWIEEI